MRSVAIIGGGIGGLTAAIRLAYAGYDVSLFEKNDRLGGKLGRLVHDGFVFDMGPTVLTMPFVFEDLFRSCGRSFSDYVTLRRVEPTCRYFWSDDTCFDAWGDRERLLDETERVFPADRAAMEAFLDENARLYEATKDVFLFNPFRGPRELVSPRNARLLPMLRSLGFTATMAENLRRRFDSEKLVQLFARFATYNGSSPYRAPATLNVIPHVELGFGAWYPERGMFSIVEGLERLAREVGVVIHTSTSVERIHVTHGTATGLTVAGERIGADVVIANTDPLWTYRHLIAEQMPTPSRLEKGERSCSGFLILASVDGTHDALAHHNVFFSDRYEREFEDIFDRKRLPEEMTVYLSISAKSIEGVAPPGKENWYLLINAPSSGVDVHDVERHEGYARQVFRRLETFGLRPVVLDSRIIGPGDFEALYNAPGGAIYGGSSNSMFSAFLRPPNRPKKPANLFFVGGSTHPGGGVPLVALSGGIVARMIIEDGR